MTISFSRMTLPPVVIIPVPMIYSGFTTAAVFVTLPSSW